jgi:ATP-dependent RNA helicase DeaD
VTFTELGLEAPTLEALARLSFDTPVSVQTEAIPALIDGRDVVMEAPTGSGKTLAYLVPMVDTFAGRPGPGPRALVVTPTRELAIQIAEVLRSLGSDLRSALLYGGIGYATQTQALKASPDVVIGTPGRLLDMVGRKLLSLSRVEYLVLDEADEMLDAGFAPDVERILKTTYEPQMVLASATMPDWVVRVIERHLHEPVHVRVAAADEPTLEHGLVRVNRADKLSTLSRLLRSHRGSAIVFGRTKHGVRKLNKELRSLGHSCLELQGNLSQAARDRAMQAFRDQRSEILVATNVAARGLDISHVGLVINYELPDTPQWLTHRVGRTARMGERGRALTFVAAEDRLAWDKLRRQGAPDVPEIDIAHLLAAGGWRYRAPSVGHAVPHPAPGRPARRRPRRRRPYRGGEAGPARTPQGTDKGTVSFR